MILFLLFPNGLAAQTYNPTLPPPPTPTTLPANPDERLPPPPEEDLPAEGEVLVQSSGPQAIEGDLRTARENLVIRTPDMLLQADQGQINIATGDAEVTGNVYFENLATGELLRCDAARYNVKTKTGTFYNVNGSAPARIESRPGVLTTDNPFYFQGEWADVKGDQYTLHNGFLTDCKVPGTWWLLQGSSFDIVPGDHATTKNAVLKLKGVPLFYMPYFRKSLKKQDRRSGFLTPNIGNSSFRGQTIGVGYYWAINRSSDLMYRTQYYTQRGFTHTANYRVVFNPDTSLDAQIFGVPNQNNTSPPGYIAQVNAKAKLGKGWTARGELRQLSSMQFRQEFSQSFNEAVYSETHSVGYATKHWSNYGMNIVAQHNVNYQSIVPGNQVVIGKLPEVQFTARPTQVKNLPFWISMDSSYGLERRTQPAFQTRRFVQRADFAPRLMTTLHWKGFHLTPSVGIRETAYDSRLVNGQVNGQNLIRHSRDVSVELILPELTRVFQAPTWLNNGKVKHVIEPRVTYRYATGINDFTQVIRFDDLDLISNTHEVEFSLTNRILARNGTGGVRDLISWQIWYKRYLDPTFGGAVISGQRNVVQSSLNLTGYAFIDKPRNQSPIVNVFRIGGRIASEWRADYDPVRHRFVNSTLTLSTRLKNVTVSASHSALHANSVLAPNSNQLRFQGTYGGENRRGWNYGAMMFYDYKYKKFQEFRTQVTYNTDCCGFSVQYRQPNYTGFQDHQIRVALALSNIGSFGTLQRQQSTF